MDSLANGARVCASAAGFLEWQASVGQRTPRTCTQRERERERKDACERGCLSFHCVGYERNSIRVLFCFSLSPFLSRRPSEKRDYERLEWKEVKREAIGVSRPRGERQRESDDRARNGVSVLPLSCARAPSVRPFLPSSFARSFNRARPGGSERRSVRARVRERRGNSAGLGSHAGMDAHAHQARTTAPPGPLLRRRHCFVHSRTSKCVLPISQSSNASTRFPAVDIPVLEYRDSHRRESRDSVVRRFAFPNLLFSDAA